MTKQYRLTDNERGFLSQVARITYGNPFSDSRLQLLEQLLPDVPGDFPCSDPTVLAKVVAARLERFDRERPAQVGDFPAQDQPLLDSAYLYFAYHRFLGDLDGVIRRQLVSEKPVEVTFHHDFFAEMHRRGIADDRAVLFLGFFFQLRRAFHFILESLVGECPSMWALRRALWSNVFTHDMQNFAQQMWNRMEDFSTLLLGETGTGKGSAAAAIGRSSFIPYLPGSRRFAANFTRTFVTLNLSQFPETLIESELFGHRKGAFTGAVGHYDGVLAHCHEHGALFLDEIGEVSVPIQIKLLQVLQDRTFVPLGSHEPRRFQGRVIAATNRALPELQSTDRFRDDFFYRLCSDIIVVPTLRDRVRERPLELDELIGVVVQRMTGEPNPGLITATVTALQRDLPDNYPWPGNVRELEQAVRRVILTGHYTGRETSASHDQEDGFLESIRAGSLSADELIGRYCAMLHRRNPVYADVAEKTNLDRRTVRKHILKFSHP